MNGKAAELFNNKKYLIYFMFNRFSEFGLYPYNSKCNYEYISVYDGHNETARLIGQYCRTVPELLRSTRNNMYIKLITNNSGYKGFNASYTSHRKS